MALSTGCLVGRPGQSLRSSAQPQRNEYDRARDTTLITSASIFPDIAAADASAYRGISHLALSFTASCEGRQTRCTTSDVLLGFHSITNAGAFGSNTTIELDLGGETLRFDGTPSTNARSRSVSESLTCIITVADLRRLASASLVSGSVGGVAIAFPAVEWTKVLAFSQQVADAPLLARTSTTPPSARASSAARASPDPTPPDSTRKQPRKLADGYGLVKWGASKRDVRAQYPTAREWKGHLVTDDTIAGYGALVYFLFADDTLVASRVFFTVEHSNDNDFLSDFDHVDRLLNGKYGDADTPRRYHWRKSLYRDDTERWGMAVAAGHLWVFSLWDGVDTEIEHALTGDNFKVRHAINYRSVAHKDLKAAADAKQASDGL